MAWFDEWTLPQSQQAPEHPLLLLPEPAGKRFPIYFQIDQQIVPRIQVSGGPWRAFGDTIVPPSPKLFHFELDFHVENGEPAPPLEFGYALVDTSGYSGFDPLNPNKPVIPQIKMDDEFPSFIKVPDISVPIHKVTLCNSRVFLNTKFICSVPTQNDENDNNSNQDQDGNRSNIYGCFIDVSKHKVWFTKGSKVIAEVETGFDKHLNCAYIPYISCPVSATADYNLTGRDTKFQFNAGKHIWSQLESKPDSECLDLALSYLNVMGYTSNTSANVVRKGMLSNDVNDYTTALQNVNADSTTEFETELLKFVIVCKSRPVKEILELGNELYTKYVSTEHEDEVKLAMSLIVDPQSSELVFSKSKRYELLEKLLRVSESTECGRSLTQTFSLVETDNVYLDLMLKQLHKN